MLALSYFYPIGTIVSFPINLLGILPFLFGFAITIIVKNRFEKLNAEIHTFKSPNQLITTGLFQYSRNPIYVGFTISLIGIGFLLGAYSPFIMVAVFIIITNYIYMPHEERAMEELFGKEYRSYKSSVRRWV